MHRVPTHGCCGSLAVAAHRALCRSGAEYLVGLRKQGSGHLEDIMTVIEKYKVTSSSSLSLFPPHHTSMRRTGLLG